MGQHSQINTGHKLKFPPSDECIGYSEILKTTDSRRNRQNPLIKKKKILNFIEKNHKVKI